MVHELGSCTNIVNGKQLEMSIFSCRVEHVHQVWDAVWPATCSVAMQDLQRTARGERFTPVNEQKNQVLFWGAANSYFACFLRCGRGLVPGSSKVFLSTSCRHPCRCPKLKRQLLRRQQSRWPRHPVRQCSNPNHQVHTDMSSPCSFTPQPFLLQEIDVTNH